MYVSFQMNAFLVPIDVRGNQRSIIPTTLTRNRIGDIIYQANYRILDTLLVCG